MHRLKIVLAALCLAVSAVALAANAGERRFITAGMSEGEVLMKIGTRSDADQVVYPDVDLALHEHDGHYVFTHKNGEPYPAA